MLNTEKYLYTNIRKFLEQDKENDIGETDEVLSDFSCPRNKDVENFLKNSSVEFTKKNQSVTYLVFSNEDTELLGYFTIALKPLTVEGNRVSNTVKRKLQRVSKLDEVTQSYTTSAYLIAQLGKNYTDGANERISGGDLLEVAWTVIKNLQYEAGGMVAFLEAEKQEKLLGFYKENGFIQFGTRETRDSKGNSHVLIQLLRLL